jgi:hypothetical protein
MKRFLSITTLASLALLFCSNSVWAGVAESEIASPPGPEAMFLFGAVLFGLVLVNRFKFKN